MTLWLHCTLLSRLGCWLFFINRFLSLYLIGHRLVMVCKRSNNTTDFVCFYVHLLLLFSHTSRHFWFQCIRNMCALYELFVFFFCLNWWTDDDNGYTAIIVFCCRFNIKISSTTTTAQCSHFQQCLNLEQYVFYSAYHWPHYHVRTIHVRFCLCYFWGGKKSTHSHTVECISIRNRRFSCLFIRCRMMSNSHHF